MFGRRGCRPCIAENRIRIQRSTLVKVLFFWLPLKHYRCTKCLRQYYSLRQASLFAGRTWP